MRSTRLAFIDVVFHDRPPKCDFCIDVLVRGPAVSDRGGAVNVRTSGRGATSLDAIETIPSSTDGFGSWTILVR